MSRLVATIAAVITLSLAGSARAEEPASQPAQAVPAAAPVAAAPSVSAQTSGATAPQPRLDLFPTAVLADVAGRPMPRTRGPSRPAPEQHRVVRFDTGDGWKGQAAMGAAMVGGFAALVALCRGGRCMELLR